MKIIYSVNSKILQILIQTKRKLKMKNKIHKLLCELGISEPNSVEQFYPKVRDRDDISVMKCTKSGVLFLSQSEQIDSKYYPTNRGGYYPDARKRAILDCFEDDNRRANQFGDLVRNKKWLEIGTGAGGILDLLAPTTLKTVAIEPQNAIREELIKQKYNVHADISDVSEDDFDIATLFHVFEHFTQPLETLEKIVTRVKSSGKVIVEVPHANDFLISFLNLESFKAFTFWSEHLILHTRQSLKLCLEQAGLKNISIMGYQRYPLANHLHWLSQQKPGGHLVWNHLKTPELDSAYADMLKSLDKTDTLIAIGEK